MLLHLLLAATQQWSAESGRRWEASSGLCGMHTFFFESPDEFPEVVHFVKSVNERHCLDIAVYNEGFKRGLQRMLQEKPIRGIFLGTRHGDPNCKDQVRLLPGAAIASSFLCGKPICLYYVHDTCQSKAATQCWLYVQ